MSTENTSFIDDDNHNKSHSSDNVIVITLISFVYLESMLFYRLITMWEGVWGAVLLADTAGSK